MSLRQTVQHSDQHIAMFWVEADKFSCDKKTLLPIAFETC